MVLLQYFVSAILLLGVTSEKAYSPYENIQLEYSNIPNLIYASSESNPAFGGYSYTTRDINGGGSNVIFTTGADSVNRIKSGMDSMKIPERDTPNKLQENLISSNDQSIVVESSMNKQEDYNLSDAVSIEAKNLSNSEAENNLVAHQQASPQLFSFLRVSPYPAVRANLLPLSTYHVPSNLQAQFYSSNSHLELPLSNIGYYNPAVPLFYQGVSNNNIRHVSTAAEDVKVSTKSQITKNSQTATDSKSSSIHSNVIESRSHFEPNTVEETSDKSAISASKFESMIISERSKQKTARSGILNHAEKSENSVEQISQGKESGTELTSTEISPTNTSTTKKCTCD